MAPFPIFVDISGLVMQLLLPVIGWIKIRHKKEKKRILMDKG